MAASNAYTRGHSEFGHIAAGPTDVPWGEAGEEAVQIQIAVQNVELHGAGSKSAFDVGITRADLDLVVNGIDGSLTNIHRFLGLATGDITGSLPASDEVLSINAENIGEAVREVYSLGAGALSLVRRIEVPSAKPFNLGPLAQTKTGWMIPSVTFRCLNPGDDIVMTIRDISSS